MPGLKAARGWGANPTGLLPLQLPDIVPGRGDEPVLMLEERSLTRRPAGVLKSQRSAEYVRSPLRRPLRSLRDSHSRAGRDLVADTLWLGQIQQFPAMLNPREIRGCNESAFAKQTPPGRGSPNGSRGSWPAFSRGFPDLPTHRDGPRLAGTRRELLGQILEPFVIRSFIHRIILRRSRKLYLRPVHRAGRGSSCRSSRNRSCDERSYCYSASNRFWHHRPATPAHQA